MPRFTQRLRAIARVLKESGHQRLRTGTRLERKAYFAFFNDGFRREQAIVSRGHQAYYEQIETSNPAFLIRRNTHMIEKGLIMRPRRGTFAAAYIEQTIAAVRAAVEQQPTCVLSVSELAWVFEVLDQFFEATSESTHPAVVAARANYRAISTPPLGEHAGAGSGPQPAPVDAPPVGIDELLALARRRKSVRWFTDQPVDRAAIDRAMEVAAAAPSACNRQPFEFRIYDDPALVEQVAAVPLGTNGYAHNIPVMAVIVGNLSAFYDERDRHLIYIDGCLAAMSFIHGLEAQGLGTCCINWPDIAVRERAMRDLINLAPYERPVMLVAIGHPDPAGQVPHSAKRSLEQLRSYNKR